MCYGLELFWKCHGRGQWDGATTHVKNVIRSEQVEIIGAMKLQNVADVCIFLQTSMGKEYLAYLGAQW